MRLIDADALDSIVHRLNAEEHAQITRLEYKLVDSVIFEFPTIDAVPVIRCEDCKYCSVDRYADGNVPDYVCIEMDCGVESDGFCAWAERKEE